jgi:hypothetical protein
MYDIGISSIVTLQYWYFLVLYSVTILVIPVSRPAASYYPNLEAYYLNDCKNGFASCGGSPLDTVQGSSSILHPTILVILVL